MVVKANSIPDQTELTSTVQEQEQIRKRLLTRIRCNGKVRHGNVSKFFGPRSGHLSSAKKGPSVLSFQQILIGPRSNSRSIFGPFKTSIFRIIAAKKMNTQANCSKNLLFSFRFQYGLEIMCHLNEKYANKPRKFEFFLEIDWKSSCKNLNRTGRFICRKSGTFQVLSRPRKRTAVRSRIVKHGPRSGPGP